MEPRTPQHLATTAFTDEEKLELAEQIELLRDNAAFQRILTLLRDGRTQMIEQMIDNAAGLAQAEYAKLAGVAIGLAYLGNTVTNIEAAAESVRTRIVAEARADADELTELAPDGLSPAT